GRGFWRRSWGWCWSCGDSGAGGNVAFALGVVSNEDASFSSKGRRAMQGKWRCLIVEDDAETARYIADGLGQQGHATVICRDGVEALTRSMEQDWDLIILDRMLPNQVDGLSILSTLRGLGKETPVLVLSALNALDERVRGLKAGGDDYLTKP